MGKARRQLREQHIANKREPQQQAVEMQSPSGSRADQINKQRQQRNQQRQKPQTEIEQQIGCRDQDARWQRQGCAQGMQKQHELRHNLHQKKNHRARDHRQRKQRVSQRLPDTGGELILPAQRLTYLFQDLGQAPARLTRANEINGHGIETLLRERLREGRPRFNRQHQRGSHRLQTRGFAQITERVEQRHARAQ